MKVTAKLLILTLILSSVASAQEIFEAVRNGDIAKVKGLVETERLYFLFAVSTETTFLIGWMPRSSKS